MVAQGVWTAELGQEMEHKVKTLLVGAITASLLVAVGVTVVSLLQTPTYETSAMVLVDVGSPTQATGNGKIQLIPNAPAPESLQGLAQRMAIVIDSRPVADEVINRLGLGISPDELLKNLSVEQAETPQLIRLTYTDTDPARAKEVVGTVGRVAAERITGTGSENLPLDTELTANVYEKAEVPEAPVSPKPLRNGLLALVAALALSAVLIEARRRVFGS